MWGGDPNCNHEWTDEIVVRVRGVAGVGNTGNHSKIIPGQGTHQSHGKFCKKCGAWYGQLGLEPTSELYVEHLIEIFREVKRVLKPYGNLFVVIDDTYSGGGGWNSGGGLSYKENEWERIWVKNATSPCPTSKIKHIPRKSLCLVPELFAIRMVYELGFILRNKIIWVKKIHLYKERTTIGNAMPESVKDRLTHTWEYVFHFVKEPKYYYDLDAVRIPHKETKLSGKEKYKTLHQGLFVSNYHPLGANPGDVIQINTEPFPEAHFAVFPTRLVEFLIKVGCPEQVCKKCGKPRERIYERIPKHGDIKSISGKYINADELSHSAGAREKYYTTIRKFKIPKSMQVAFAKWLKQYVKGNEDLLDEIFGGTKWEHWIRTDNSGVCLPEPDDYRKLKELLDLPDTWDKWLLETVTTLVDDSGNSWRPYAWSEYCECGSTSWTQGMVLDPFLGSGTTALVALKMGRKFIGIELNREYCEMALRRIRPYLAQKTLLKLIE